MVESDSLGEEAKTRDYKLYQQQLFDLIRRIGLVFMEKADPYKVEKEKFRSELVLDQDIDVFGNSIAFFPKVDKETVEILIKMLGGVGVFEESNDMLAILRHFHHHKYK